MEFKAYISRIPFLRRFLRLSTQAKIRRHSRIEGRRRLNDSASLGNFESRTFSQNGEDGIIREIFRRIGSKSKSFVEFGVEDGRECNTRLLLQAEGWTGLWIDGGENNVNLARKQFASYPIKVLNSFITKDNIVSLFSEASVPLDLDLLSIDIDGNDYWVWEALRDYTPRVVIIEYNASHPPMVEWVMPYDSNHVWDGTNWFGASLRSLEILGTKLGYSLVACDSNGVNAFFVRQDLLNQEFSHQGCGSEYFYCAPKYGVSPYFFGHRPCP
jgi:hypothetical protein